MNFWRSHKGLGMQDWEALWLCVFYNLCWCWSIWALWLPEEALLWMLGDRDVNYERTTQDRRVCRAPSMWRTGVGRRRKQPRRMVELVSSFPPAARDRIWGGETSQPPGRHGASLHDLCYLALARSLCCRFPPDTASHPWFVLNAAPPPPMPRHVVRKWGGQEISLSLTFFIDFSDILIKIWR